MQLRLTPLAAVLASTVLLAACASTPIGSEREPDEGDDILAPTAGYATVAEAFLTADTPAENIDSPASWIDDAGKAWLIATAKDTHRLAVYDGDSGTHVRDIGGEGAELGQFNRPNGIAVLDDLLFVVERDNRRVQVLRLPAFSPVGEFGSDQLRSPYGLWLHETAPDALEVYVTDSYMQGERFDVVPPLAQLDQRVRRYGVELKPDGGIEAKRLGAFGSTAPEGALRMVESIAGDPARKRLLIADEYRPAPSNLRVYDFSGRYSGRSLPDGTFLGEAEGVALWPCRDDLGYWVAVDQQAPLTSFHLFDRDGLAASGSFHGRVTAQTDGIALHAAATARFPSGVLFAVHDDRAVVAFDLGDVTDALHLDPACLP